MKSQKRIFWLIPLIVILLAVMVPLLPVFNLKTIKVETEFKDLAEEIARESGLKIGSNMFLSLLGKGNIFALRFIGSEQVLQEKYTQFGNIKVRASLPSEAIIEYTSKQAVFEIEYDDYYLVTDINGCVLDSRSNHELGFVRVTGVNIDGFALGCIIGENLERFELAATIYRELEGYDKAFLTAYREYVNWIDISNPTSIALMFDDRVLVKLDDSTDLAYQTAYMCSIFTQDIGYSERGTLDFTAGDNPVFSPE
ncbi:MAG: hypothetical protein R3232_00565 [Clostridia bacterium]|nr:hypothetical protein [Clostridia bacterium]